MDIPIDLIERFVAAYEKYVDFMVGNYVPGDNGNGGDEEPEPEPSEKIKVFKLKNTSKNGLARLFLIHESGKKYYVSDEKKTVPNGTVIKVYGPKEIPHTDNKPFKLLAELINNYVPGYDGPDMIDEIYPPVGWYITAYPQWGENKGKMITGVVFNDGETGVYEDEVDKLPEGYA